MAKPSNKEVHFENGPIIIVHESANYLYEIMQRISNNESSIEGNDVDFEDLDKNGDGIISPEELLGN